MSDFDIRIVDVEPVSRPMKPIPSDCVIKACIACHVQFVIKRDVEMCPRCNLPLTSKKD